MGVYAYESLGWSVSQKWEGEWEEWNSFGWSWHPQMGWITTFSGVNKYGKERL